MLLVNDKREPGDAKNSLEKILVVEDSEELRELLTTVLRDSGILSCPNVSIGHPQIQRIPTFVGTDSR
ncbi:MAG: response regulator [Bacteroidetes bacterium]|nr:response regulator [Bacteroidota bacterium]MCL5739152.1 response regulator [Bacteroidota bacterium]